MNKNLKGLDAQLQRKLSKDLPFGFDNRFYQKLDQALHEKNQSFFEGLKASLSNLWPVITSGVTVASITFILVYKLPTPEFQMTNAQYSQMIEMEDGLENLELFSEVEDLPETSEEWDVLLTGKEQEV